MADRRALSRRAFLAASAAAAASLQVGLAAPAASASRARLVPQNRIGIQLFTVRD